MWYAKTVCEWIIYMCLCVCMYVCSFIHTCTCIYKYKYKKSQIQKVLCTKIYKYINEYIKVKGKLRRENVLGHQMPECLFPLSIQ